MDASSDLGRRGLDSKLNLAREVSIDGPEARIKGQGRGHRPGTVEDDTEDGTRW